ncbi:hypothetical protein [Streptosporangium saharense]|uniref:hypothetical protein n=1 Tax=Streptosporangium saharense TaxID=1706840 RepID=UPI00333360E8
MKHLPLYLVWMSPADLRVATPPPLALRRRTGRSGKGQPGDLAMPATTGPTSGRARPYLVTRETALMRTASPRSLIAEAAAGSCWPKAGGGRAAGGTGRTSARSDAA